MIWGIYYYLMKFYEQQNLQLDIRKAKNRLKWKPKYSITESVNVTNEWYKKTLIEKQSPLEITTKQIKDFIRK